MNIFCYCSPYKYYLENLTPLLEASVKRGHNINISFSDQHSSDIENISEISVTKSGSFVKKFFNGKYRPDVVILVQPWWYVDKKIANFCKKNNISLYVIDHAAPMSRFVEKNGKKSHLYRSNLGSSKAFFCYGRETANIMKKVGCKSKLVLSGSPRVEEQYNIALKNIKNNRITIYDTSHRMESRLAVNKSIKSALKLSKHYNLDILIKEHPRSSKLVRNLLRKAVVDKNEIRSASESMFCIFTMPSSSMLLPALLGKKIIAGYSDHFSDDIKRYYKRYKDEIPNKNTYGNRLNEKIKYNNFIKDNLELPTGGSAEYIIKWIEKNENRF